METKNKNYYVLPFHAEAYEILENLGFDRTEDKMSSDPRDIDSYIINGFDKNYALYSSDNLETESERLQNIMNERIIPLTFNELKQWQS